MVAYRFCRPDDIPLLLKAVNECYCVHFPEDGRMSLEEFQAEVRELDVWPSNCMIASAEEEPVSVCIATKRPLEVLVYRIGTHPDFLRQGHAGHLLDSLAQKLEVLGPGRVVSEIPEGAAYLQGFFQGLGFKQEVVFTDYGLEEPLQALSSRQAMIPVQVRDLTDGLLEGREDFSWIRQAHTLVNMADSLEGSAIASPDGIEAFLVWRRQEAGTEILALGCRGEEKRDLMQTLLLRDHCQAERLPVKIPRVSEEEVSYSLIESMRFKPGRKYARYANQDRD
jgi:ribosomal protein S18 acetylase RimI-like enzyme